MTEPASLTYTVVMKDGSVHYTRFTEDEIKRAYAEGVNIVQKSVQAWTKAVSSGICVAASLSYDEGDQSSHG